MRLNAVAYYADFFISGAIILALFAGNAILALKVGSALEVPIWIASAITGLVVWSLLEYAVHRFIYHRVPIFDALHDAHHAEPEELIGAPPLVGISLVLAMGYLALLASNFAIASGITSGLFLGYMGYMLVHHASHHWKPRTGTWLYMLRRHHALHHYRNEEGNFGIITSFWDHLFGTAFEPATHNSNRGTA